MTAAENGTQPLGAAPRAGANVPAVASARDYVDLLKPRIMALVVFTAIAGLAAGTGAGGGAINPVMAAIAILAVALGSGAAAAINMWYDADIDAVMGRTRTRPIPAGKVPRDEALALGLILSGLSVILIWMASNTLSAFLLALSIAYYGVFYTMWLKRRTPQNIVIGGGAGAFPPVIGWTVATGSLSLDAWLLFAIIFFWTPPHFWALSLLAKGDYGKAGIPMLPNVAGAAATRRQIGIYTVILIAISLAPVATGLGGWLYAGAAMILGAVFGWFAWQTVTSRAGEAEAGPRDKASARRLFVFSILYLTVLYAVVIAEHGFGLHGAVGGFAA